MPEFFESHHHGHQLTEEAARRAPLRWGAFRDSIKYRWAVPFAMVDWLSQWAAYGLRKLSILELMETCSSFTLLVGLIFYFAEAPERTKTKHYQAWQVINTAQGKGGNGGRIDALRELNEDGVPLVGVDVSDSFLQNVRLEKADLRRSTCNGVDFKGADLRGADLEESHLRKSNFREVRLDDADLTKADLFDSDLTDATLAKARLSGARLGQADLRGADLAGVSDWNAIGEIQLANIHGVRNPPEGFVDWAKGKGAVDLVSDDEWEAVIERAERK